MRRHSSSELLDAAIYVVVNRGQRVASRSIPSADHHAPAAGGMVIAAGAEIELRLSGGRAALTKRSQ